MARAGAIALVALALASTGAAAKGDATDFDDPAIWARTTSDSGTVFYECLVAACVTGSTVSVNAGPATAAPNVGEMVAMLPDVYAGLDRGVFDVQVTGVRESTLRDLAIGRFSFRLIFTAALNPLHPFWMSGVVFDPEAGEVVSVVSSSQDAEAAALNFTALLKRLVASR
ncbi:MAG: hypothetical protein KIS96_09360 [Bauldia sp.]|nr:hypothetical protein [Bauldia sp.]